MIAPAVPPNEDAAAIASLLAAHRFFAGIPEEKLRGLAALARRERYGPGERLCEEGGEAQAFYAIVSGTVRLTLHVPGRGDTVLETVGAGDAIGWSWAIAPHRWAFGAVAADPAEVLVLPAGALREACARDAELAGLFYLRLAAMLAERLRHARLRLLDLYGSG